MNFATLIRKPSAFLPTGMPLAVLATVLVFLALFGVPHQADEEAAAHIWQLLMGLQVPIIVVFLVKWLPRTPKPALAILALLAVALLAACAPVYFFRL